MNSKRVQTGKSNTDKFVSVEEMLALVLQKSESVTFSELYELREILRGKNISLVMNRNSFSGAIRLYRNLFKEQHECVCRGARFIHSLECGFIENEILWETPQHIRTAISACWMELRPS